MVYLYWLGAFIIVTPLILSLPFLSRNRVYRTATLFAGMNAGIITLWIFINLLRWGPGPTHVDQFYIYFTYSLPGYYIASLAIGSTFVSRYYLNSRTYVRSIFATLCSLIGLYILSSIIVRLLELLSIIIYDGLPSFDVIMDMVDRFMVFLTYPDLTLVVLIFVSAFISLNGTAAAMRISDEAASLKDEEA